MPATAAALAAGSSTPRPVRCSSCLALLPSASGHAVWARCRYNPIKTIKTSFLGTMNMLGLAKRTRARFLISSTSEVSKSSCGSLLVTVTMLASVLTPQQLHRQGKAERPADNNKE